MELELGNYRSMETMSFQVPEQKEFRAAVNAIEDDRDRTFIQASYLGAFRVSEIITKIGNWELDHKQSKPYGKELTWKLDQWQQSESYGKLKDIHKVLIIKAAIAKRKTKTMKDVTPFVYKQIALPAEEQFEPWTKNLLQWLVKHQKLSFDISRHTAHNIVKKHLLKLDSRVHHHSLRHWRITHLVTDYGFEAFDLSVYAGWTFRTVTSAKGGGSGQLDTYLHLGWQQYFPKLLKPLRV